MNSGLELIFRNSVLNIAWYPLVAVERSLMSLWLIPDKYL
jgi:hypothetical protein